MCFSNKRATFVLSISFYKLKHISIYDAIYKLSLDIKPLIYLCAVLLETKVLDFCCSYLSMGFSNKGILTSDVNLISKRGASSANRDPVSENQIEEKGNSPHLAPAIYLSNYYDIYMISSLLSLSSELPCTGRIRNNLLKDEPQDRSS